MSAALTPKQTAGLELLRELRGDFEPVHETLTKILSNITANPSEAKFRRLRTTNERIKGLLAAKGARQLLVGSGFAEEAEALVLPEDAELSLLQAAVAGLAAQQDARKEEEAQAKKDAVEQQRARAMAKRRAEEPAGKTMQAKASHILLKATDDASFAAVDARIANWKAEIEDAPFHKMVDRFQDLAKAHSDCPSGARGGGLGFFPPGKMVEEFDAIAFHRPVGKLYGPIRTANGSHLIFLHSRIEK